MTQKQWTVPYAALGEEAKAFKEDYIKVFEKVLLSGQYILGPELSNFEMEFASYCQTPFSLGVANGTDALYLTMQALNLKKDAEVITVSNSFIASASSIALAGAKPVFVDIGEDGNMDPNKLESVVTKKTKAIIAVHLTGRPAKMPQILEIAKKYNLFVIEDAAQSVGASIHGKRVGSWGDAACFSLHPLKNLKAIGDGGMITTKHEALYNRLKIARNHGLVNREQCDFWSYNTRLDELQASFLRIQLRQLDNYNAAKREMALRYNRLLKPYVKTPDEGPGEYCVYQTYVILAEQRDGLQNYLIENGVQALIHYATPIHLQPAAKYLGYKVSDFPQTMKHVDRILSLPLFPSMTYQQQDWVAELIKNYYTKR
ncbi:MAG: DegT/DnrJ/EryC1/StrS family aminotransferase [Bacteroidetes bacterium]|nr:DegT/DnrJ/EryC1/StrS family aminotransferase [Bacteroidota bacterium]